MYRLRLMNFTDKSLKLTLFANYGFYSTSALIQIISLPLYVKLFGLNDWAYIGYLLLAQSLFAMIDSGLIVALQRIFASELKKSKQKYNTLKTFEFITLLMLIIIMLLTIATISIIYFFRILELDYKIIISIFGGVGIYVALAISLPHKALLLMDNKQIQNNGLALLMLILRHLSALILLNFYLNILIFILAHFLFALIESIVRIIITWLNNRKNAIIDFSIFFFYKNDLLKLTLSTIVGAAVLQMDKLIAASLLDTVNFAKYTIAATLGIGVIQFFYPTMQTTLPKYLSANGQINILLKLNIKIGFLTILILASSWILWLLIGVELIDLYLGSSVNNEEMYEYITIFLVGSSLFTFSSILQNNVLSFNLINVIFYTNIVCLVLITICQPIFINSFDIIGACLGWILVNVTSITIHLFSIIFFKRRFS